ncbi:MAG: hypothetical protein Q8O40_07020 [Chloroflexota bacterium]|nr:hypothetical protein [Chloroflexota bacterium]
MTDPMPRFAADKIERLVADECEAFSRQVLDFEVARRHINGRVDGPASRFVGDGGLDLEVTVNGPPRTTMAAFPHAITEDRPAVTGVSCKGGKNAASQLRKDARGKEAPVEVLRSGGSFVGLLSRRLAPAALDKLAKELTIIFARRLSVEPETLSGRVRVYDANHLAGFCSWHPFHFDKFTESKLGVDRLPHLFTHQEWEAQLQEQRGLPTFVSDTARRGVIEGISGLLARTSQEQAVAWVNGPPGVGEEPGRARGGQASQGRVAHVGRAGLRAGPLGSARYRCRQVR